MPFVSFSCILFLKFALTYNPPVMKFLRLLQSAEANLGDSIKSETYDGSTKIESTLNEYKCIETLIKYL